MTDHLWDSLDPYGDGPMWYDREGRPITMRQWGELKYQSEDYRRIGHCLIISGGEPVEVSTVWLGLDHRLGEGPPLIFETLVFGGPHDGEMERYATEVAALAGHDRWAARESHLATGGQRPINGPSTE